MRKAFILTLFFAFMLSACGSGGVKATVADDNDAKAKQIIVEKWIAAYQKRDAQALLSLWSDKITWSTCSAACQDYRMDVLQVAVPDDFSRPEFKVEFQSYTVTNTGTFAIIHAIYQDPSRDAKQPTPSTCILQFAGDKIISETWYGITS
jgi:hypothetical protein